MLYAATFTPQTCWEQLQGAKHDKCFGEGNENPLVSAHGGFGQE